MTNTTMAANGLECRVTESVFLWICCWKEIQRKLKMRRRRRERDRGSKTEFELCVRLNGAEIGDVVRDVELEM